MAQGATIQRFQIIDPDGNVVSLAAITDEAIRERRLQEQQLLDDMENAYANQMQSELASGNRRGFEIR